MRLLDFIPWSAVSMNVTSGWAFSRSPTASSSIAMLRCDSGSSGAYVCMAKSVVEMYTMSAGSSFIAWFAARMAQPLTSRE